MIDGDFILGEWEDSLIWCPSQCNLSVEYQGRKYQIYLRWRWDDPWSADLIDETERPWHALAVQFWRDEQIMQIKRDALGRAKEKILELHSGREQNLSN